MGRAYDAEELRTTGRWDNSGTLAGRWRERDEDRGKGMGTLGAPQKISKKAPPSKCESGAPEEKRKSGGVKARVHEEGDESRRKASGLVRGSAARLELADFLS